MAINFETVTGNQTSANVLTQINNNFAKVNTNPVPNADFATNADTIDNKHASELIPGAAIFLDSITSLDDLSVGRYFCTQTRQGWEPVTTAGSRTFLIEVSLDIPNNLKSYKINYIAGEGAGESYYSDYSSDSIKWNRVATNENVENLLSHNYLVLNNRKIQPILAQDGYYMIENHKQADLITDDGTKYFKISASEPVDNISTITIEMYNTGTDELLDSKAVTCSTSSTPNLVAVYSDNSTIIFYISNFKFEYVVTFSENSIVEIQTFNSRESSSFHDTKASHLNDNRYSNDNYIVGRFVNGLYGIYNKLTKNFESGSIGSFIHTDDYGNKYTLYYHPLIYFVNKNINTVGAIGLESGSRETDPSTILKRPAGFIFNIDTKAVTRLALGSINSNLNAFQGDLSTYGGIVIVGDFVYISAALKLHNNTDIAVGIFKFRTTDGAYVGYIPYDGAGGLKLLYQDDKTILCADRVKIFTIDVDSFTIKNYVDNGTVYVLNPDKTIRHDFIPPGWSKDKYHKIAVDKAPSGGGVSRIDYYLGYNSRWIDIGGF